MKSSDNFPKQVLITGHRKIPKDHVRKVLLMSFRRLKDKGVSRVLCGMAKGTDIIAARVALDTGLELKAYIPYYGHEAKRKDQKEYWAILSNKNTKVVYTHEGPWYRGAHFKRNQLMVADLWLEDFAIAIMSDSKSGTGHCVRQIKKNEKDKNLNIYNPETRTWNGSTGK